jgi:hypothetical protein
MVRSGLILRTLDCRLSHELMASSGASLEPRASRPQAECRRTLLSCLSRWPPRPRTADAVRGAHRHPTRTVAALLGLGPKAMGPALLRFTELTDILRRSALALLTPQPSALSPQPCFLSALSPQPCSLSALSPAPQHMPQIIQRATQLGSGRSVSWGLDAEAAP